MFLNSSSIRKAKLAAVLIIGALSVSGCATKRYVNDQIAVVNSRIDSVDAKAQDAMQRADAAAGAAQAAGSAAQTAGAEAQSANQRLDQLTPRVDSFEQRMVRKRPRNRAPRCKKPWRRRGRGVTRSLSRDPRLWIDFPSLGGRPGLNRRSWLRSR